MSVVGARPQFVKLGPVAAAMEGRGDHFIVHTGQHYDELMSDVFFRDLGIPAPDVNLAVGSASHGAQTGKMLEGLEQQIESYSPDWVLVYGDTNSTLAAAIAAVKLHVPVAHLEAGLRSFNRRMPEEHNRVLTDHASDLLLAPTDLAMKNLAREGLRERSVLVGDVMTDVLLATRDRVAMRGSGLADVQDGEYLIATLHRPDNTDDPDRLRGIIHALSQLPMPVVLLAHPRLRAAAADAGITLASGSIVVNSPLPYPQLVAAVMKSAGVITDSGGLQKEAFLLRVPTTTIRSETEWPETVELGWNVLVDQPKLIGRAVTRPTPPTTDASPYGDGATATRVIDALASVKS